MRAEECSQRGIRTAQRPQFAPGNVQASKLLVLNYPHMRVGEASSSHYAGGLFA
jgi:hypothetical protein